MRFLNILSFLFLSGQCVGMEDLVDTFKGSIKGMVSLSFYQKELRNIQKEEDLKKIYERYKNSENLDHQIVYAVLDSLFLNNKKPQNSINIPKNDQSHLANFLHNAQENCNTFFQENYKLFQNLWDEKSIDSLEKIQQKLQNAKTVSESNQKTLLRICDDIHKELNTQRLENERLENERLENERLHNIAQDCINNLQQFIKSNNKNQDDLLKIFQESTYYLQNNPKSSNNTLIIDQSGFGNQSGFSNQIQKQQILNNTSLDFDQYSQIQNKSGNNDEILKDFGLQDQSFFQKNNEEFLKEFDTALQEIKFTRTENDHKRNNFQLIQCYQTIIYNRTNVIKETNDAFLDKIKKEPLSESELNNPKTLEGILNKHYNNTPPKGFLRILENKQNISYCKALITQIEHLSNQIVKKNNQFLETLSELTKKYNIKEI